MFTVITAAYFNNPTKPRKSLCGQNEAVALTAGCGWHRSQEGCVSGTVWPKLADNYGVSERQYRRWRDNKNLISHKPIGQRRNKSDTPPLWILHLYFSILPTF